MKAATSNNIYSPGRGVTKLVELWLSVGNHEEILSVIS